MAPITRNLGDRVFSSKRKSAARLLGWRRGKLRIEQVVIGISSSALFASFAAEIASTDHCFRNRLSVPGAPGIPTSLQTMPRLAAGGNEHEQQLG
jgi:hypothetical protein